jgi:hypothetical protein
VTVDRDLLELECQVRFVDFAATQDPAAVPDPTDLFIEGFWQGVRAAEKTRSLNVLQRAIEVHRSRAAAQFMEAQPCETPTPSSPTSSSHSEAQSDPKAPRRVARFG